jgi:hypothetical protein
MMAAMPAAVPPSMPATTGHMPATAAAWTHAHVAAAATTTAHMTAAATTTAAHVASTAAVTANARVLTYCLREAWGCRGQRHCKRNDGCRQYWFEIEHIRNSVY